MCGIVAFHGPRSAEALQLVEQCLLQAARRGTHATGLAWLEGGELHMEKAPVSAMEFVQHFDLSRLAPAEETLSVVAHTRYSTSDLAWNQPLEDDELALVMNGVISQDAPHTWPLAEIAPYATGNDAEVAMRFAKNDCRGQMPGSFAIVELWRTGAMLAYRNGYRPLYKAQAAGGWIIASAADMLMRCGVTASLMAPGYVTDIRTGELAGLFDPGHEQQPAARDPRSLRCPTE